MSVAIPKFIKKLVDHKWLASFVFWSIIGCLFIVQRATTTLIDRSEVNWYSFSSYIAAIHLGWFLLTIPLFNYATKYAKNSFGKYLVLSLAIEFIHAFITTVFYSLALAAHTTHAGFSPSEMDARIVRTFISCLPVSWLTAIVLLGVHYGWTIWQSYTEKTELNAQLQNELSKTQLQMLRMQLNPHFIFNAFNTISMMVRTGKNEKANEMLTRLAELLRSSLYQSHDNGWNTIEKEIEFCERYLEIERVRFADRLQIQISIDHSVGKARIPHLLLQPLVENAFKHGMMDQLEGVAQLVIEIKRTNDAIDIRVVNTGQLKNEHGNGIGIANVKKRLELHYQNKSYFGLSQANGKVTAHLSLPYAN